MIEQAISTILLLLLCSLLTVIICHKLKFPLVVAYIIVGIILGPFGFHAIKNQKLIHDIAEFGLVFLLFSVGLVFSLKRLMTYKLSFLLLALGQLFLTSSITFIIGIQIGMNFTQSIIVGAVVAMSSTAIVTKQLKDQNELALEHSPFIISILLMQDLAVIPAFMFVTSPFDFSLDVNTWLLVGIIILKSLFIIALIILFGKYFLRPIFHWVHQQDNDEIFTLATLFIAIGLAWFTHVMGLSWILGGFIAGMILAETEFRIKLEHEVRPFKDILMGLFFIAVGTQLNLPDIGHHWPWIALLLSAVIIGKFLIIFLLGLIITKNKTIAFRTGLCLSQGGEFGFALLVLALNQKIFPEDYAQVILASLLISMILAAFMIRYNAKISGVLFK